MVGPDVAGIAGFGLPGLFQAENVPQVAVLAPADRAVYIGLAYIVALLTGKKRYVRPFENIYGIALLVGREAAFRDGLIHGKVLGAQITGPPHSYIGR